MYHTFRLEIISNELAIALVAWVVFDEVHYMQDRKRGGGAGGDQHLPAPRRQDGLPVRRPLQCIRVCSLGRQGVRLAVLLMHVQVCERACVCVCVCMCVFAPLWEWEAGGMHCGSACIQKWPHGMQPDRTGQHGALR